MSEEYGEDFVPTVAQQARADQQFARTRDAIASILSSAREPRPPGRTLVVALGLVAADKVIELSDDDDSALGAACALIATAVAELERALKVVRAAEAWHEQFCASYLPPNSAEGRLLVAVDTYREGRDG